MSSTPRFCGHCGTPLNPGARFCGRCGAAVQGPPAPIAGPGGPAPEGTPQTGYGAPPPAPIPPPPAPVPPHAAEYPAAPPAYGPPSPPLPVRPRRRRKLGCLGCAGGVVAVVLLLACGLLVLSALPRRSDALALGKRVSAAAETIGPGGGTLVVRQPGSAIDGLSIVVPPGAYGGDTTFAVSTRPILEHRLGPDFHPITPLIHVEDGHGFAAEPMTVHIPVQVADDEFAMAFFYDLETGLLEGLPLVDLAGDRLTVLTSHFSDIVVSAVKQDRLREAIVDTGFTPGVDDWQVGNHGSIVHPKGHCAGLAISAMWYYGERRLGAGEPPLHGRFDNNQYGFKSPALDADDSWGQRLASTVQSGVDWDARSRLLSNHLGSVSDVLTWHAFAYAMLLTGEPQYVSIGRYVTNDEGKEVREGHALVAYKIEPGRLYVADPNRPGGADAFIRYEGGALQPYLTGVHSVAAAADPSAFAEIRYMAKSALVDWDRVGALYEAMLAGEAGAGVFPRYSLKAAVDRDETTGEIVWAEFPRVLEVDEAQTARVHEDARGQLWFLVSVPAAGSNFQVHGYNHTQLKGILDPMPGETEIVPTYELEPGVNHIGWLTLVKDRSGAYQYLDFWRIKVIYGRPDLAGAWEGTFRIDEAANVQRYVEDGLARVLLLTGLAEDEARAREIAGEAVVEDPGLRQERPLGLILEIDPGGSPGQYRARLFMVGDDGQQNEYAGQALYEEGAVRFSISAGDGSTFHFEGELQDMDHLSGTLTFSAWGVVQRAGSGTWQLARRTP